MTALAVHDGLLYSSANDLTVRLWDGHKLLMTLAEGVDLAHLAGERLRRERLARMVLSRTFSA